MRPNSARARSAIAVRSARDVTSVRPTLTRRPRPFTSAAVRSAPSRSSSATTMSAPRAASSSAVARPMPRPAPVTIATCPESSTGFLLVHSRTSAVGAPAPRRPAAWTSDFDWLDHPGGVKHAELAGREAQQLHQHAVGVLAEQRRRARDRRGLGAMQADRRDRYPGLAPPRTVHVLPDAERPEIRGVDHFRGP